jgi:hypothetical protein
MEREAIIGRGGEREKERTELRGQQRVTGSHGPVTRSISLRDIPHLPLLSFASLSHDPIPVPDPRCSDLDDPTKRAWLYIRGRCCRVCPPIGPRSEPRHVHFVNHLGDIPGSAAQLNKASATTSPQHLSCAVWQRAGPSRHPKHESSLFFTVCITRDSRCL